MRLTTIIPFLPSKFKTMVEDYHHGNKAMKGVISHNVKIMGDLLKLIP